MSALRPYTLHDVSPLEVVRRDWLCVDSPELHLRLSDGRCVLIQWDLDYGHRLLLVAPDMDAPYTSCTADQTGLTDDQLGPLVDEVYRAVEEDEAERLSDQDDGREWGT